MESRRKSQILGSEKFFFKEEKKEKKEEIPIQRSRKKSRTIIDKDFSSFSLNYKYSEYCFIWETPNKSYKVRFLIILLQYLQILNTVNI